MHTKICVEDWQSLSEEKQLSLFLVRVRHTRKSRKY
jgi:hypothetical protein